ncbi:MAG: F0F1 ATP synthase subunit gamma [Hyphomicrobiales bacterium]|nr:F0F1 ATP synthase subunit gamma [Hyphomicrobiales bacterium]MDE2018715.1 F0F1 ATP synthase subunit gamma [Hyphomicrobiales bacterium]
MPSLKDLRNRIASVKATQKITKAMQMVAAAKLRRAQTAAEAARPYAQRMEAVLADLAGAAAAGGQAPPLLAGNGRDGVHLLLVCTGERGLCGAFNSAIARLARERANSLKAAGKTVRILCVGRKGADILRRTHGADILDVIDMRAVKSPTFADVEPIGRRVVEMFGKGEFDVCTLFYSRFGSVISQVPTALRIVPAAVEAKEGAAAKAEPVVREYEPDQGAILAQLLPRNVTMQVYRAVLENGASFFGAQMSAMDNATRNAGEMAKKYTLRYNRTRQAMITKELIEIISGAEAL